jgi:hypothetical protein
MAIRFEHHKNFITPQECVELNAWADKGVANKWLDVGFSRGHHNYSKRFTSRLYADRYEYPEIVRTLSSRIRKFCGVSEYGLIEGHGRDGVVVSCTFPGGDIYEHQDPRNPDSFAALRCNVLTRAADSGGILHLEGKAVSLEVGELHCYLASEHKHAVSEVVGSTSRVLWMFGAYVPKEDWDSGLIKCGN